MKKFFLSSAVLFCSYLLCNAQTPWDGNVANGFSEGNGTKENPYLISDASQLAFLAKEVNAGTNYSGVYLQLVTDIDLNSLPWEPIGNDKNYFAGNFQGNGKTISNMSIDLTDRPNVGLFGTIDNGAIVEGLKLDESCSISAEITTTFQASAFVGGIAGLNHGTIKQCSNSAIIKLEAEGNANAFGISYYTGGIAGESYGPIEECFNLGNVSCIQPTTVYNSTTYAGGITGAQFNNPIQNCYNMGNITSQPYYAGGIAGQGASKISNSYSTGKLESPWSLSGGISGIPGYSFTYVYVLEGSTANSGGGIFKTVEDLKSTEIIDSLNMELENPVWVSDASSVNYGYPILSWQSSEGITIKADETINGSFDVYLNNEVVKLPTSIKPGSEIKLVAKPEKNYVLKTFLQNSQPIVENTLIVYTSCTFSAEFQYSENVQLWDGSVAESYSSGNGTKEEPFLISTPSELALLAKQTNNNEIKDVKYFKLINNIDLNLIEWTPIGNAVENTFSCYFDGNHKTIANLAVTSDTNKLYGLFGVINPVEVKDLGIIGASFLRVAEGNAGSIAGINYGTIQNCYSECKISANFHINNSFSGGICGKNSGQIRNCYYTGGITGKEDAVVAGLVADNQPNGTIESCYLTAKVAADVINGSAAGCLYNQGSIDHCYYLKGCSDVDGGAIMKTDTELKAQDFQINLNREQVSKPWMTDTISINGGFPILKWQAGAIFPVNIDQPQHGHIKVFASDKELSDGDKVVWEQELVFTEEPDENYIIDYFTTDSQKIYGKTAYAYDRITISSVFLDCPDVKRWDGSIADNFAAGTGTIADPYVIETPAELAYLAKSNNSGEDYEDTYFILKNNLDMRSLPWQPIGNTVEEAFKGTFNGNGKLIANLNVDNAAEAGLFGIVTQHSKAIEKIGIAGISIIRSSKVDGGMSAAGAIVGRSFAPINACFNRNGCIYSPEAAGGIVGNNIGNISNCYNAGYVLSDGFAGGIVGANSDTISYCYNKGLVETLNAYTTWANGTVGASFDPAFISECYNVQGGSQFNEDGSILMEAKDMKTDEFASTMNNSQETKHWATDVTPEINDGFIILKWQDPRSFTITTSVEGKGTITPTTYVSYGESLTIKIEPAENYILKDVIIDDESVGSVTEYTFTNITKNHTVVAYFEIVKYNITVSFGEHGSITPESATVAHGEHITFTIQPDENYSVADVLVDGFSMGALERYTFTNVTSDHTIHAEFTPTVSLKDVLAKNINIYAIANHIYIECELNNYDFKVYSIDGQLITNRNSVSGDSQIDITNKGVYIIEIVNDGEYYIKKVSVK